MSTRIGSLPVPAPAIPRWRAWMIASIAALFLAGGLTAFAALRNERSAPAARPAVSAPVVAAPAAPAVGLDQLARLRRVGFATDAGFAPAETSVSRPAHRAAKVPATAAAIAAPRGFAPAGCSTIHGPC